jgi:hypothetical protein
MPKTMTATEVVALINGGKSAIIATGRKNGSPHTVWNPIAYVEEKLYTYGDSSNVVHHVTSERAAFNYKFIYVKA